MIFFLLFLTSPKSIEACSKGSSKEKFIFNLAGIWFKEIFVPGKVFLDAVKGDYSDHNSKIFQDCFDVEEYDVLERFHLFFDLRLNMLNEKDKKNGEFPVTDMWQNIVKDAAHVLDEIVPNQEALREQLEKEIEQALQHNKNILQSFL